MRDYKGGEQAEALDQMAQMFDGMTAMVGN